MSMQTLSRFKTWLGTAALAALCVVGFLFYNVDSLRGAQSPGGASPGAEGEKEGSFGLRFGSDEPSALPAWARAAPGAEVGDDGLPSVVIEPKSGLEFVLIRPGTFERGGRPEWRARKHEMPRHTVTLTRPFYMAKTEVTQAAWTQVMGDNPSRNSRGGAYPVERVGIRRVAEFLRLTGLRLPTEAEWEWACRAGGEEQPVSSDSLDLDGSNSAAEGVDPRDVAWVRGTSGGATQPVGQKQPNAFGLHDMYGNVSEMTGTWFDPTEYARVAPKAIDPTGPERSDSLTLRGSSFTSGGVACFPRGSMRGHRLSRGDDEVGFRVVGDLVTKS